jgi:ribosome-binding protein aMBF1 (putative translation factor)
MERTDMKVDKRKRLERDGWRFGNAQDLLGLSSAEALLVESKLTLADAVRAKRLKLGWTQARLAKELGSSQSRVAKMEAGDRSVSIDLLVAALGQMGATRRYLSRVLAHHAA